MGDFFQIGKKEVPGNLWRDPCVGGGTEESPGEALFGGLKGGDLAPGRWR